MELGKKTLSCQLGADSVKQPLASGEIPQTGDNYSFLYGLFRF